MTIVRAFAVRQKTDDAEEKKMEMLYLDGASELSMLHGARGSRSGLSPSLECAWRSGRARGPPGGGHKELRDGVARGGTHASCKQQCSRARAMALWMTTRIYPYYTSVQGENNRIDGQRQRLSTLHVDGCINVDCRSHLGCLAAWASWPPELLGLSPLSHSSTPCRRSLPRAIPAEVAVGPLER